MRERSENGQFIPISAMVMFTMVVFMIAMVNVYRVSRAKLKVQNLADAAALNLASQEAQAYNSVADKNEWMNYMMRGGWTATAGGPGMPTLDPNNPCPYDPDTVPGISCVENTGPTGRLLGNARDQATKRYVFNNRAAIDAYSLVVKTINDAQKLYVQAYNSFLGVGPTSNFGNTSGGGNMQDLMKQDIPEFKNDPSLHLVAWNDSSGESKAKQMVKGFLQNPKTLSPNGNEAMLDSQNMIPLRFAVKDVEARYLTATQGASLLGMGIQGLQGMHSNSTTLGKEWAAANKQAYTPVGYLVPCDGTNLAPASPNGTPRENTTPPCPGQMPTINVAGQGNARQRTGVGVAVTQRLDLPVLGAQTVSAVSKAYIVSGSGQIGRTNSNDPVPVFKPSYWVKLAN